jgi:CarD family transcriptional regulator
MHGAGIIEAVEERNITGERQAYYVMLLPGEMRVFIPTSSVANMGLRQVVSKGDIPKVLDVLRESLDEDQGNWNRRYRANLEKMRTGCIMAVAEVVGTLTIRDRTRGLSTGEKRMLEKAQQILVSELTLVENISEEEAQRLVLAACG